MAKSKKASTTKKVSSQFILDFDTPLSNENFENDVKITSILWLSSNISADVKDELCENLKEFLVVEEIIVEPASISDWMMKSSDNEEKKVEEKIQTLVEQYNTIDTQLDIFDIWRLDTIHVSLRAINTHPRWTLQTADIQNFWKVINTRNLWYTYQNLLLWNDPTLSILLSQYKSKIMTKERFYELCELVANKLQILQKIDDLVNEAIRRYLNPSGEWEQYRNHEDSVLALSRILQWVRYILWSSCVRFPVEQYGDTMVCLVADTEKAWLFMPLGGKKDKLEGRDRISLLLEL